MCTALGFKTKDYYFGRTFDWHCSYGEKIIVTPRNYSISYRHISEESKGFAIVGAALDGNGYPLYYDAVNEKGLCMAGLNFPNNAYYNDIVDNKTNIATFEFIPYILRNCENITQAKQLLCNINLTNDNFSDNLPNASLHWIISDKNGSLTVESTKDGLKVYDNPVNVLTNNPPFDLQLENLKNYENLSPYENKDSKPCTNEKYFCTGTGAIGLPGDNTSMSRFVRTVFNSKNAYKSESNNENFSTVFKILSKVECIKGCVKSDAGDDYTVYISCCNADKGVYYLKTYNRNKANRVDIHSQDLDDTKLKIFDISQNI